MRRLSVLIATSVLMLLRQSADAQSLHVQTAAPLAPGVNQASVDSFVGPHFWFFMVQPGHFHLVFAGAGTQEGFSIGGRATAGMAFAPSSRTSRFTVKQSPNQTVFDGHVAHLQKVVVEVDPARSPLVRQTTDYTLTLTGDVGAAGPASASSPPPIVGVYMSKIGDAGAVRFSADGSVTASNGANGSWKLFDADSRLYSITLGGFRYTATLSPGRGLIDTGNHNMMFELQR